MKPEEQVRAGFEAMTVAEHAGADISRNASGGYQNFYLQCAWEGYRAAYAQARREALEEAAKLVRHMSGDKFSKLAYYTLHDAADAIGALIKD